MEGFDPKAMDEILDLRARGLRSVAILSLYAVVLVFATQRTLRKSLD